MLVRSRFGDIQELNARMGWAKNSRMIEQYARIHSLVSLTEQHQQEQQQDQFEWTNMFPAELVDMLD